jgi:cytidylate kinase
MTLPRRMNALVGHQLSRWEASGRPVRVPPCIAIASLPGAGGEELGRIVAERLGYRVFDREIVDEIARRRGVSDELIRGLDGRVRNLIDRYTADFLRTRSFNETDFLNEVVRAVFAIGQHGGAVIVGRGSAFILGPHVGLRVGVVAPLAVRVERFAKQQGLEPKRAESILREEDERRTQYIRHHFRARLDDPLHYDLMLNSGAIELDAAASLVIESLHIRFPRTRRGA